MNETAWLDDLRPLLPGAVDVNIKQSIRSAVNEFCVNTGAFESRYPDINIQQGVSEYSVPDIVIGKVLYLLAADYDAVPMRVVPRGKVGEVQGTPSTVWLTLDPVTVVLGTPPDSNIPDGLSLLVALAPLTTEDSPIPESFGSVHYQTILDGALGRLMKQPAKPWTDVAMSAYHLRRFRVGMARAKELTRKGMSSAALPWVFPKWA